MAACAARWARLPVLIVLPDAVTRPVGGAIDASSNTRVPLAPDLTRQKLRGKKLLKREKGKKRTPDLALREIGRNARAHDGDNPCFPHQMPTN